MAARRLEVIIAGDAKGALKAFAETDAGASGLGGKLASAGKLGAAGLGITAAAAVGAGVALFKIGENFDDAYDKIRVGTGKTGKDLDGLKSVFKDVVRDVPTSFGAASDAIVKISQKTGLTGKPLRTMTDQMLELSRLTKTDLGTNLESVTSLFNNFGIGAGQQSAKLDELFRASQQTGISVGDLAGQMSSAGTVLRGVGLNFDQSATLIAGLSKAGVDASQVMPALSKTLATAAKLGKPASQVFHDVFQQIKKAPSDTKAAADAIAVFGAKAGPKLALSIREGKLSLDDLGKTIAGGHDTIMKASSDTQDFGEKWEKFKNRTLVALEPIASKVFDGVGKAMDKLPGIVDNVTSKAKQGWDNFLGGFQNPDAKIGPGVGKFQRIMLEAGATTKKVFDDITAAWDAVTSFISDHSDQIHAAVSKVAGVFQSLAALIKPALDLVRAVIERVVGIITDLWARFGNHLLQHIQTAFNTIIAAIRGALQIVKGVIEIVTGIITLKWGKVWQGIKDTLGGLWNTMVAIVRSAINTLSTIIGGGVAILSSIFANGWGAAERGFHSAWDHIIGFAGTLATTLGNIMIDVANAILWPFRAAFNTIADIWNATVGSLHFTIPSWVPGLGGKGWSAPTIGHWNAFDQIGGGGAPAGPGVSVAHGGAKSMATGGVASRPMLARIGDAGVGNPEIVSPERLMRQIVREESGRGTTGLRATGGDTYVYVYGVLDGRQGAQVMVKAMHDYRLQNGGRFPWEPRT